MLVQQGSAIADSEFSQTERLIQLFNKQFSRYRTVLVRGEHEPLYTPANDIEPAKVIFAHGFFNSAMHEIAHWCLAGEARREKIDYGYWYCPDGRDEQQQLAFEQVEVKPQAIEWAFTVAAGRTFRVSTDNLNGFEPNRIGFLKNVEEQLIAYLDIGFPSRAQIFIHALQKEYKTPPLTLKRCINCCKDY